MSEEFDDDPRVLCRCSNEQIAAEQARRLGCDQTGGCPELRDAMTIDFEYGEFNA
jgi:hypothetical protein